MALYAKDLMRLGRFMPMRERNSSHHHMGTGVQTLPEVDRLMENTVRNLARICCFDTGHIYVSDGDNKRCW